MVSLTWHAAAEFVRELRDEVVVDAILERTEDNDRSGVLYGELLDSLVRQHIFFAACNFQYEYYAVYANETLLLGAICYILG